MLNIICSGEIYFTFDIFIFILFNSFYFYYYYFSVYFIFIYSLISQFPNFSKFITAIFIL